MLIYVYVHGIIHPRCAPNVRDNGMATLHTCFCPDPAGRFTSVQYSVQLSVSFCRRPPLPPFLSYFTSNRSLVRPIRRACGQDPTVVATYIVAAVAETRRFYIVVYNTRRADHARERASARSLRRLAGPPHADANFPHLTPLAVRTGVCAAAPRSAPPPFR